MAETFSVDLTIGQGEVILKALDLCGANDDFRTATQHFNDVDLARNAKPTRHIIHSNLRRAGRHQTEGTDVQRRPIDEKGEVARLRQKLEDAQVQLTRTTEEFNNALSTLRRVGAHIVAGRHDEAHHALRQSFLVAELFEP